MPTKNMRHGTHSTREQLRLKKIKATKYSNSKSAFMK
jgi:hypothetical protein